MMKTLSVASLVLAMAATSAPSFAAQPPTPAHPAPVHHRVVHHVANNCKHAAHSGTAGGAILGALAGQALGHNTGSTVVGGAVGAAAGHQIRYSNCKRRYG